MSWARKFDKPITLPNGGIIKTLADARAYILDELPKTEQAMPKWQTAAEVVLMAAEDRGPMMHANAGMYQAIHGLPKPPEPGEGKRRDRPWMKRK